MPRRLFLWSLTPSSAERPKKAVEQTVEFWTNMPAQSAVLNPRKPFAKVQTEEELAQVLGRITVPTIMMGGTEDNISSPELMLRTLRALKGSSWYSTRGVDHVDLPIKCREDYVGGYYGFLSGAGSSVIQHPLPLAGTAYCPRTLIR